MFYTHLPKDLNIILAQGFGKTIVLIANLSVLDFRSILVVG